METKDEWIGRTLESLDGMESAGCPPELQERMIKAIPVRGRTIPLYTSSVLWKAAAVILILLGLNIVTIFHYSRSETKENESAGTVASEYFSYINNFNL
jgi:hypothetical protein